MDKRPTLVFVDFPTAVPLAEPFLVRGWVASDSRIVGVHVGALAAPALAWAGRPDVRAANPDHAYTTGFCGRATFADLRDSVLRVLVQLEDGVHDWVRPLTPVLPPADKSARLARIRPRLRPDLPFSATPFHFNFLTPELRAQFHVEDTTNVSGYGYAPAVQKIITSCADELVLDCGAGRREECLPNVVNLDIAPYPSTDVLAVAEQLPFLDDTFAAVISCAVLEHVKDPFRAAREIVRVTRPGGTIYADVPFLQPYHGYPAHYYNMTSQGLVNLFASECEIVATGVPSYGTPIWTLTWFLNSYLAGLPEEERASFRRLQVADLLEHAGNYRDEPFVRRLSAEKNFELASVTSVTAIVRKPARA